MTAEKYILLVLRRHVVKKQILSRALSTAKELYPSIRMWASYVVGGIDKSGTFVGPRNYLLAIRQIGSFAKGTNILGATDLDLFISLNHRTPGTLSDIYYSLSSYLKLCHLSIKEQNVSIRINYKGLSVDLVPAKKQSGPTNDHSIYRRKMATWMKTNVHKHIAYVKSKARQKEIRAIKIWRERHSLEFPSFYLELSVIEALKGQPSSKLSMNLQKVFEYLSSDFGDARILDPANSNNIVSEDLTKTEKCAIAKAALSSRMKSLKSSWDQIIW